MTKEQYKNHLIKKGYTFENDTGYLKTPYGLQIEEITKDTNGFSLISKHNPRNILFGVSQSHCGHEYRWIFDEREVQKQLNWLPKDGDCEDILWPMGGSNSSATFFEELKNDEDILGFLTVSGEPDLDDPELVDIGEYLMTIETGDGSITQEYLDRFDLKKEDLTKEDDCYGRKEEIRRLSATLKEKDVDEFDCSNPFYGENKSMRYSEFMDLCEKYGAVIFYDAEDLER